MAEILGGRLRLSHLMWMLVSSTRNTLTFVGATSGTEGRKCIVNDTADYNFFTFLPRWIECRVLIGLSMKKVSVIRVKSFRTLFFAISTFFMLSKNDLELISSWLKDIMFCIKLSLSELNYFKLQLLELFLFYCRWCCIGFSQLLLDWSKTLDLPSHPLGCTIKANGKLASWSHFLGPISCYF